MLRNFLTISLLLSLIIQLTAQSKFEALYDFNSCSNKDINGKLGDLNNIISSQCLCGVDNDAIVMNANSFELPSNFDSLFKANLSICFDVLIDNTNGEVDILSKSNSCNADTTLNISYRCQDSTFLIFLKEGNDEAYVLFAKADPKSCWQNVCLSINGIDIRIYVNGKEAANLIASDLLRLDNISPIKFNNSDCQNNNLVSLNGRIDRVIFANYAFNKEDVNKLFIPQQKIITPDTIIFIGDQVQIRASSNCPSGISWSPNIGLSSTSILNPIADPIVDTRYAATFQLGNCRLMDSVIIRVVDKDKLQCEEIRLPSAFTPNGDNLNEEYFISNPYIISSLSYFDILDRNGSVLFNTTDPLGKWDGTFKSKILNSGTFYYRIQYTCKNKSYNTRGSFFLMR